MAQKSFNWHPVQINKLDQQLLSSVPLCSTVDVQLRFLCPDDLDEVRTLCQDWFPIDYPLSWYEDITSSTRFFALAAVNKSAIIGLIVAEIKAYAKLNKEDKGILADYMGRDAEIGYILSLGVHKKYRRNGIGSLLLNSLVDHLTTIERHRVKAIFLHVLTTNQPAILFYEHRRFFLHSFLPYYYSIRGKFIDGYIYVSYINGGHPPWTILSLEKLVFAGDKSWWTLFVDGPTDSRCFPMDLLSYRIEIQFFPMDNSTESEEPTDYVMNRDTTIEDNLSS